MSGLSTVKFAVLTWLSKRPYRTTEAGFFPVFLLAVFLIVLPGGALGREGPARAVTMDLLGEVPHPSIPFISRLRAYQGPLLKSWKGSF